MPFNPNQFSGSGSGPGDIGDSDNPPSADDLFQSILNDDSVCASRDEHRFLSVGLSFYAKFKGVR